MELKYQQASALEVSQEELEQALADPKTYFFSSVDAEAFQKDREKDIKYQVVHTHMSMVFLLPDCVFKVKKHVNFGFSDFSTLNKRLQACIAEVELNKRLAPEVYLGVVPISMKRETREICVRCDDYWTAEKGQKLDWWRTNQFGEIVEFAVYMVRLPDDYTLLYLMDHDKLTATMLIEVANKLVKFHANARRGSMIDQYGQESVIRHNIDENFYQTASHTQVTVSEVVYRRVKELSYSWLTKLKETFNFRVKHGYICDTHGDLRLEHVYKLPRSFTKNERLVILDCIEFNEQFRFGDPLSDIAFLSMDIWRKGRPDLAQFLQQKYLTLSDQDSPMNNELFTFYAAYRAVVRAKVCGFRAFDSTLSLARRNEAIAYARCYWLVALELLTPAPQRPCLILVGGLPASGKSSLVKMLVKNDNSLIWLRADAIRKELARQQTSERLIQGDGNFEKGLYSSEMTKCTYDEILKLCVEHLRNGHRVIVDATFRDTIERQRFVDTARTEGALFAFIVCQCDREIIKKRIKARTNDISDATWEIYEHMEQTWQYPTECSIVNTEQEIASTLHCAEACLRKIGLL